MQHLATIAQLAKWREALAAGQSVGFIPTMGALHEGHASLMRAASDCEKRIVSIFVNPLQFDRAADLAAYPQTLDADLALCRAEGIDAVFTTSKAEMYPADFTTHVEVSGLDSTLCGATRPGHFRGVTTVVAKLFNLVQPTRAYFGEKDFQQLTIIRRMVKDLNMPLEVVPVATQRAGDGLALSSRNVNLTAEQRRQAPAIYAALSAAKTRFLAGELSTAALIEAAKAYIESEIQGARIDYLEIVDAETLQPLGHAAPEALMAAAVFVGEVRLIDNLRFAI